jgi:signal transduction histidine kinase
MADPEGFSYEVRKDGEVVVRHHGRLATTRIALEAGKPLPTLAVWIDDTGGGMDADELRQATTPFFTTRTGGTGLGLAVAEYWVARHRGSLHLESEKGAGTRVRVTLPIRSEP